MGMALQTSEKLPNSVPEFDDPVGMEELTHYLR